MSVGPMGTDDSEADIHVGVVRAKRVKRPGSCRFRLVAQPQRAQPDRLDGNVGQEPVKELGGALDGNFDVLNDALAWRAAVALLDAVGNVEPLVVADQLPDESCFAGNGASRTRRDARVLRTECS